LMFPWLAHGHMYPFVELAKRLSRRDFRIYICSSPVNLTSFRSLPESNAGIELIELKIPSDELPPELHTTKNLPSHLVPTLMRIFQDSDSSFSEILSDLKPDLLIYDGFQPWAAKLASEKGIPAVFFSIAGSSSITYFHHLYTHGDSTGYPFPAIFMPSSAAITTKLPPIKGAEEGFLFGVYNISTDIVLVNSYRELEAKYLDYLSVLIKKKVVPTGPLISATNVDDDNIQSDVMEWLQQKPQFSTLYVSFGSEYILPKDQLHELAQGLELAGVNFIWVLRFSSLEKEKSPEEALPEGFIGRTKDRGWIITDWAPQSRILAHRSVGGFVSHCGWNSLTEGVYFGVPIIAMPMSYEQPLSAKML
ncbi:hypothetical protein M569_14508, partial [Genlisea aurea]